MKPTAVKVFFSKKPATIIGLAITGIGAIAEVVSSIINYKAAKIQAKLKDEDIETFSQRTSELVIEKMNTAMEEAINNANKESDDSEDSDDE